MIATTWIREFVDGKPVHPAGRKDDAGKPRWDLVPTRPWKTWLTS